MCLYICNKVYIIKIKPFHFNLQISAQESRRKKKEFVDTLERKVDVAVQELDDYKKKCELLQKQNTSLRSQLKSLRTIVANNNSSTTVAPSLATPTIKPDPDCKLFLN